MLKNTVIYIIAVFCFFSIWQLNSKSYISSLGTPYETYVGNYSSTAKIIATDNLKIKFLYLKTGESVLVLDLSKEEILQDLNAKVVFTETTIEGVNIYAYSDKLKNKIQLNGETVNVQIFYNDTKTVIGTPIIFGSF